jgi:hypothetical protein
MLSYTHGFKREEQISALHSKSTWMPNGSLAGVLLAKTNAGEPEWASRSVGRIDGAARADA